MQSFLDNINIILKNFLASSGINRMVFINELKKTLLRMILGRDITLLFFQNNLIKQKSKCNPFFLVSHAKYVIAQHVDESQKIQTS